MMKRASFIAMLVILLVSLFPIIYSESFYFNNCDAQIELERLPLNLISDDSNEVNLTWTSRTQLEPQLLGNGSSAVGDHVVLNAIFPDSFNITHCEMRVWNGFFYNTTRPLVIPTDPAGVFDGIIDHTQLDWIVIKGIEKGLRVNITCNFTNDDSDFMAWDGTQDQSEYTYADNLVDMASGDKPEHFSFIWSSDNDTMILGCLDYDGMIGNWTILIQVGVDVSKICSGSSISMDTYYQAERNQTCNILATGYTDTNESIILMRENVSISNFFAPDVRVNLPTVHPSDDKTYNISWSCSDRNADDVNYYSVWLSGNDGISYMLLVRNLTRTWHLWNSTYWFENDYTFRVRAYSLDFTIAGMTDVSDPPAGYWPGDYSDTFTEVTAGYTGIYDPNMDVGVIPAFDITYSEGESGNWITWTLYIYNWGFSPSMLHYKIYRNETLHTQDIHYFSQDHLKLSIDVDGLSEGAYNFTLYFINPGSNGGIVCDVVFVFVNVTNPQDWSLLIQALAVGVSICSVAIITIVIILSIRLRRNRVVEYV